eukprot:5599392-Pleurochrysis_carterae.AAC.1
MTQPFGEPCGIWQAAVFQYCMHMDLDLCLTYTTGIQHRQNIVSCGGSKEGAVPTSGAELLTSRAETVQIYQHHANNSETTDLCSVLWLAG